MAMIGWCLQTGSTTLFRYFLCSFPSSSFFVLFSDSKNGEGRVANIEQKRSKPKVCFHFFPSTVLHPYHSLFSTSPKHSKPSKITERFITDPSRRTDDRKRSSEVCQPRLIMDAPACQRDSDTMFCLFT